jgi:hypothetical protein
MLPDDRLDLDRSMTETRKTRLSWIRTGTGSLKLRVEVLLERLVGRFRHCRCEFGLRFFGAADNDDITH